MKLKKIISIFLLFAAMFSLTACQKEADISITPLFYKVSDENSSVYILGSIHVGSMSIYPLPAKIMSAYKECGTVMFELDFSTLPKENYDLSREQTEALAGEEAVEQAALAIKANYPDMKRRAQKLYPSVNMANIEQAGFHTLQGLLSLAACEKAQLRTDCGLDQAFLGYANRDKKNIIGVESWEEQYKLTYTLPPEAYKALLTESIDVDGTAEALEAQFEMWCEGDAEALEYTELDQLRQADETSFQHVQYENFLTRNEHMVESVSQQLEQDEPTFVLLGVTHIIGKEGVINQLKELGYMVEAM